jgi:hypothetical protein
MWGVLLRYPVLDEVTPQGSNAGAMRVSCADARLRYRIG